MDTETADVIGHDVTTITCVCGNTVSQNGLIQCNSQGVPVYIGGQHPDPRRVWPNGLRMRTSTLCARHAAACIVTRSSKRQGPHPLRSGSMSPLAALQRQSRSIGGSAPRSDDNRRRAPGVHADRRLPCLAISGSLHKAGASSSASLIMRSSSSTARAGQ